MRTDSLDRYSHVSPRSHKTTCRQPGRSERRVDKPKGLLPLKPSAAPLGRWNVHCRGGLARNTHRITSIAYLYLRLVSATYHANRQDFLPKRSCCTAMIARTIRDAKFIAIPAMSCP